MTILGLELIVERRLQIVQLMLGSIDEYIQALWAKETPDNCTASFRYHDSKRYRAEVKMKCACTVQDSFTGALMDYNLWPIPTSNAILESIDELEDRLLRMLGDVQTFGTDEEHCGCNPDSNLQKVICEAAEDLVGELTIDPAQINHMQNQGRKTGCYEGGWESWCDE